MKTIDYYMQLPYKLEIVPDFEEGGYAARYPELPGCLTCADTLEALINNAEDAKRCWLEACLEDGQIVPEPLLEACYSGVYISWVIMLVNTLPKWYTYAMLCSYTIIP